MKCVLMNKKIKKIESWMTSSVLLAIKSHLKRLFCRSRNTAETGKRKDPGFHPLSQSSRAESGVLR